MRLVWCVVDSGLWMALETSLRVALGQGFAMEGIDSETARVCALGRLWSMIATFAVEGRLAAFPMPTRTATACVSGRAPTVRHLLPVHPRALYHQVRCPQTRPSSDWMLTCVVPVDVELSLLDNSTSHRYACSRCER